MSLSASGRLQQLVTQLDSLGPHPTLIELMEALKSAELTYDDVAPYVQLNPRSYRRTLVALRDQYELLVMTWMPGQASVPHDHAGSICAMQVVQGDAIERSFRIAADGYVDPDYDTPIRCGEISAGQDAGVHMIFNSPQATEPLVTVHIYAPPLGAFRRFVVRPEAKDPVPTPPANPIPTVVVVGGGFSGSMTAAQLLRMASLSGQQLRVVIVERRGTVGEGVAYGSREAHHLLNVPAAKMSAWPDRPHDFVEWAQARLPHARPSDFLPRQLYGQYIRETLLTTADKAGPGVELDVQFDEVRRVSRRPGGGWLVHLAHGASLCANAVVVAIGHRPPSDPIGKRWGGPRTRMIADPWHPFALNVVEPDESVVILGAGLTAVDAVLSLAHPNRTAPITILSRRGLLPQSHALGALTPVDLGPMVDELLAQPGGVRTIDLLRRLRQQARQLASQGGDWRSVVDAVRPHTVRLWQGMDHQQRKRFLTRLRPYWEVHRHRMALAIGTRFGELRDCDWARVEAGHVMSAQSDGQNVRLVIAQRGTGRLLEIEADWVINCTGPAPSNSASANPAIGSLLVDGWMRPDPLGLGIETTPGGCAIGADGSEVADLLVVGTLRKPDFWESTAVPELRGQAAQAAEQSLLALGLPVPVIRQQPAPLPELSTAGEIVTHAGAI